MQKASLTALAGLCLLLFAGAGAAGQKKSAAEMLGFPPDAKLLILHADDLAVSHSVDMASFAALEQHAVSSASIMIPCPWLTEVADFARQHPGADLGLHLTLTSEWKTYRWGPVTRQAVPGLIAPDGSLWPEVAPVVEHAKPEEVEAEVRAQIERALQVGIHPTHLDSHMGTLFTPAFFPVYRKLAKEYGIPFFAIRTPQLPESLRSQLEDEDIVPEHFFMASPKMSAAAWMEEYSNFIRKLEPGLTEIIVHLGHDDAELQAVTTGHPDYVSAWRQRDFDLVTSPEFKKLLADQHVTLIGWKQIGEARRKASQR
jgi:chitin disaccharide deacetylase